MQSALTFYAMLPPSLIEIPYQYPTMKSQFFIFMSPKSKKKLSTKLFWSVRSLLLQSKLQGSVVFLITEQIRGTGYSIHTHAVHHTHMKKPSTNAWLQDLSAEASNKKIRPSDSQTLQFKVLLITNYKTLSQNASLNKNT